MRLIISLILLVIFAQLVLSVPGDIVNEFPTTGRCPTGLTFDGEYLWLADRLSDSLYAYSPESGMLMKTMLAPGFIPLGLTWDGDYLWCIDGGEKLIYKLDLDTGISIKQIEVPTVSPQGLAWDGKQLWLSDDKEDILTAISTEDGTIIHKFLSPSGSPQGITWDGRYLWCADRVTDRIYMMDPKYGEVLLSIDAPGMHARGLTWIDGYLWNVDYQSDKIYQIVVDDGIQLKASDFRNQELLFTYELRNYGPGSVESADVYFAIPKDRPNQVLTDMVIWTPEPMDFVKDKWDQEFAHYRLINPDLADRNRMTMKCSVKLYDARWFVFPHKVGSLNEIPKEIRKKYLVDENKYRIDDPIIQNAVKEALNGEENPYWIMRKIYRYLHEKLYYELAGGWNVAPAILERGNGSCSEYSFVFISMCRAAGLPTKYVGSVAIRGDDASTDDVFHRWCECYLPGYGWVPVDPSGGDQDTPAGVAEYFGHVANRYLITTEGGGSSEYLGWGYNSNAFWISKGPAKVYVESVGEWSPIEGD